MPWKIVEYCGPEKKNYGNPYIFRHGVRKCAVENIAKYHKNQTNVYCNTGKAQWQENFKLSHIRIDCESADQANGEENSKNRKDFFIDIHISSCEK
jgi:hypothetical protein